MATEEQTSTEIDYAVSGGVSWGQRLTISNRTVSKLSFYLKKYGSPSGTLTHLIRKVSGDSIVATKLWGNAIDVPTSQTLIEVTFDSPVFINEEVRIMATASGGTSGNLLGFFVSYPNDVKASEYAFQRNAGGAYTEYSTYDAGYIYTYTEGGNAAPVVTTGECTEVAHSSATGQGNLQSLGTSAVTQHGHVWHTSDPPSTSNSKTENGATANKGPFQSSITGLIPGTKYYVRAYAINTTGTSYGVSVEVAGNVTTIGRRHWWTEHDEFHWWSKGLHYKVRGTEDTTGLPFWHYT